MYLFKDKSSCCGCGACFNICSRNAITMQEDEYGFIYPQIDNNKCIKCGACRSVCSYQKIQEVNTPIETYTAISSNTDIKKSASGGVFASLAKTTLSMNGVVYGASLELLDKSLTPIHVRIDEINDLIKLQGSKYVQSFIGNTYKEALEDLNNGKQVLFSGTPCQIAGLKAFIKKEYDNLLCIDLICHGVPNAKIFKDYIQYLEKKLHAEIIDYKFRDKSHGWGLTAKIIYKKYGCKTFQKLVQSSESSYYHLFLDSTIYRENCYSCHYANPNRPGDITIGDYWGVEIEHPELIDNTDICLSDGVSCCVINTIKGKRYLDSYKDGLLLFPSSFEKASKHNHQLFGPSKRNNDRMKVLSIYKKEGYIGVEKWFKKNQGCKYYLRKLKRILTTVIYH